MATRTLDQIISELRSPFDAQTNSLQERANLIPQQIEAEEQGLNAKKDQAFGDIVNSARRRGLGFSGIPSGEQATYLSTDFLPAQARLRMSGREQAMSLQDAILGINERRDTLGQQIYQQEQDREFQRTQAEAQRAFEARQAELNRQAQRAAAASAMPTLGAIGGAAPQARVERTARGGFNFFDANNKPITAAQYAVKTGQNIGDVLFELGQNGDQAARQIYGQLQAVAGSPNLYKQTFNYYQQRFKHILGGV